MAKQTFFERHKAAIESGTYDKSMIRGLRKALHDQEQARMVLRTSTKAANVTDTELTAILGLLEARRPSPSTTEQGLAYLRKPAQMRALGHREREILAAFDRFAVVGVRDIGDRLSCFAPEYEVIAKDGSSFCYTAAPWQSGMGGIEVTG